MGTGSTADFLGRIIDDGNELDRAALQPGQTTDGQ